ncbi:hypothetical protein QL285_080381 [Trifolium repens]|nr:hypothetical protein QL285_080371 [Trifolium repens]KAK2367056.1 hypothetical protein QL285_080374 [Trifolium repens]KAK2367063.1 hypothetical protein QL285_080381 [Trifolium repens]
MTDRGYNNFYTPDEYESYQQCPLDNYGQTPEARLEETMIKFMEMQQQISQMQQMQDQHQQYLKNSLARSKNMEIQISQIAEQMAITQSMEVQTNTQTNPDEKDSILPEEYGESVEEDIEKKEEERIVERGGVVKKVKEMDTPHEVELPQEIPCIEKVNTVDSEKVVMDTKENDGLFDKEESYEQKKEIENKAEMDRVIDEICALFNKKKLGRTWTPHNLYFKFMEFLPNQRKKTDDVLSVSFWPP